IGRHFALQPSFRFAYLYGGVLFHFYAMLAALVLPVALVTTAHRSGVRWTPAVVMAGAVALGLLGMQIARAGFDLLQPVSVIEAEIANGNQAAVAEIIAVFRADSGEMLRAIDAALSAWDAEALGHAAHRLKGALMALAAPAASRAALRLEDIAREGDLRPAADARAALARVLVRLEPQLDALAPESVTLQ